jgi:hypothetical protein
LLENTFKSSNGHLQNISTKFTAICVLPVIFLVNVIRYRSLYFNQLIIVLKREKWKETKGENMKETEKMRKLKSKIISTKFAKRENMLPNVRFIKSKKQHMMDG